MTLIEFCDGRSVFWVAEVAGCFKVIQNCNGFLRQLRFQVFYLLLQLGHAGAGIRKDEAGHTLGLSEHVFNREHAAPRLSE